MSSGATPVVLGPGEVTARDLGSGVAVSELLSGSRGCQGLHQRLLCLHGGAGHARIVDGLGESWYVKSGSGRLTGGIPLRPGTAVWLPRSTPYQVVADSDLEVLATTVRAGSPDDDAGPAVRVVALADCAVERTGDREFRVLLSSGLAITQFAGLIPPGRAPAHHHTYDEVVHVLAGHGVVHLAAGDQPIEPGTSIYLPPYHQHCLENTGTAPLQVLGVFHPAGTPAAKR